jgi:hypothetical protein
LKEEIKNYIIVGIISILAFFTGLFLGQNQGLRRSDSRTISELKGSVQALSTQNVQLQQVLGNTARRDSTASKIIAQEINRINKK